MKVHPQVRERNRPGQPLVALAVLLSLWAGARVLTWHADQTGQGGHVAIAAPVLSIEHPAARPERAPTAAAVSLPSPNGQGIGPAVTAAPAAVAPLDPAILPTVSGAAAPPVWSAPLAPPLADGRDQAAGHQMLWLAAMSHVPGLLADGGSATLEPIPYPSDSEGIASGTVAGDN